MPLRIRILLWVSSLFLATIFIVFIISDYQIDSSLSKEKSALIEKVKGIDQAKNSNILKFLGIHFNNKAQKLYKVFDALQENPIWIRRFLPDEFNQRTKSWGSAAAVLSSYSWVDFINVEIDGMVTASIRQGAPYLRKYIKVPIEEDLTLFITKLENDLLVAYIGVPFWKNKILQKYVDTDKYPEFFLSDEPGSWLLYNAKELLEVSGNDFSVKNERLYTDLFDETVSMRTAEEYNFLLKNVKMMLNITKEKLLKHQKLITLLNDQKNHQAFLQDKIKAAIAKIDYQRNYCIGPLCDYTGHNTTPKWETRRNFANKISQKDLIWELCMLTRTGIWDFSPFSKGAPQGVVTDLKSTTENNNDFFTFVAEGFLREDVFSQSPIHIPSNCTLKESASEYQTKIILKEQKGTIDSCTNCCMKILYDSSKGEPYLTNTNYTTYRQNAIAKSHDTSITLGLALDPILINLALVSPDDIAFIFNDKYIRLYTTDGVIQNITNDHSKENLQKLLTEKRGSLIDKNGNKIYFTHLIRITDTTGDIILIEKEGNRTAIIEQINKHVKTLTHHVMLTSIALIIGSLVIVMLILSKVIKSITKPINELADLADKVSEKKLDSITIDPKETGRKDEVGSLYTSFEEMVRSIKEGNKVRALLNKVVSKEVAEKIVREGVTLGGEKRYLTVMFCDIRNFTSTSEKMDPVDILAMLNECLTLLSGLVHDFGGVIDKFEGDGIMVLFGAPLDVPHHSLQAVLCAIEMQKTLSIWNESREKQGYCKLELGVGIHTGEAVAGNVGAEDQLSYTVLGHFVNVSARLCGAAKAGEILITKETLDGAKDQIEYKENPAKEFKGVSHPITTYTVIKKK